MMTEFPFLGELCLYLVSNILHGQILGATIILKGYSTFFGNRLVLQLHQS